MLTTALLLFAGLKKLIYTDFTPFVKAAYYYHVDLELAMNPGVKNL
jgi:hypothetical protein